jgi:hypothetical protein
MPGRRRIHSDPRCYLCGRPIALDGGEAGIRKEDKAIMKSLYSAVLVGLCVVLAGSASEQSQDMKAMA